MRVGFDGLWRHPDFVRLWGGQTVSVFGSLITHTALPFAAILVLDATPIQVAVLAAARMLPSLAFGLVAGVWVDRLRRRPVMIAADIGRVALLCSVPLAHAFDALRIEHLYAVAFTTGVLTLFFDVAYQSYLPSLVTKDELLEGNSKLQASESVSEFAGFSVAGWLTQIFSAPMALLIDAGTFVASAASIASIRTPEPPPPAAGRASVRAEALDGLRAVARDGVLVSIAVSAALFTSGWGIFSATYMLFVTRGLGFDPGWLGVIFGLGGLSSLAGALMAGRASDRLGAGPAMIAGLTVMGVSMLFIPLAPGATAVGAAALIAQQLLGDGMFTVYNVNAVTLRQAIAPEHMLGRVNAFMRMLEPTFMLAGTFGGGLIAEFLGLRAALTVAACLGMSSGIWLWLSPVRRVRAAVIRGVDAPAPAD